MFEQGQPAQLIQSDKLSCSRLCSANLTPLANTPKHHMVRQHLLISGYFSHEQSSNYLQSRCKSRQSAWKIIYNPMRSSGVGTLRGATRRWKHSYSIQRDRLATVYRCISVPCVFCRWVRLPTCQPLLLIA